MKGQNRRKLQTVSDKVKEQLEKGIKEVNLEPLKFIDDVELNQAAARVETIYDTVVEDIDAIFSKINNLNKENGSRIATVHEVAKEISDVKELFTSLGHMMDYQLDVMAQLSRLLEAQQKLIRIITSSMYLKMEEEVEEEIEDDDEEQQENSNIPELIPDSELDNPV